MDEPNLEYVEGMTPVYLYNRLIGIEEGYGKTAAVRVLGRILEVRETRIATLERLLREAREVVEERHDVAKHTGFPGDFNRLDDLLARIDKELGT